MKRFLLAVSVVLLSVALVACTATQSTVGANIDNNLERLTNTLNNIKTVENSEIAYYDLTDENGALEQVGLFNGGYNTSYPNVNTYAIPPFTNYGMYPINSIYGVNGAYNGVNGAYNGVNGAYNGIGNNLNYNNFNAGYFNNGYNAGLFNNKYGYNNGTFNNGLGALWGSNIDTYRINSVTKDGKNYTTLNTYRNGQPVRTSATTTDTTDGNVQNVELVNLSNVCNNCIVSNTYNNSLKAEIFSNIDYAKKLSFSIKNNEITLSAEQSNTITDLLDNIARTTSKINMTRGELNSEINNVKISKTSYQSSPYTVNSKYVKLLSCMDTQNSYLQSILNSLLQLENCVDGSCQTSYPWNGTVTNGTCPNCVTTDGACTNCTDCPDCTSCADCGTCTNCLSCSDCTNCTNCVNCGSCTDCTDCINCENCTNCSNLANAKNCTNNDLTTQNNTGATDNTITPETTPTLDNSTNNTTADKNDTVVNDATTNDATNNITDNPTTDNNVVNDKVNIVKRNDNRITRTQILSLHNDDVVRDNFIERPRPIPTPNNNRPPVNFDNPPVIDDNYIVDQPIDDNGNINPERPAFNNNQVDNEIVNQNRPAIDNANRPTNSDRPTFYDNNRIDNRNINQDRAPVVNDRNVNQNTPINDNDNIVHTMHRKPISRTLPGVYEDTQNTDNTADETNSIINENPHENNKSLTA